VTPPGLELQWAEGGFVSLAALACRSDLVIFFYRGVVSASRDMEYEDEARAIDWADHEPGLLQLGDDVVDVSVQSRLLKRSWPQPCPDGR
jgi:hypothetical protein